MEDDPPTYDRPRAPSPARMSKVPSWISLGFVLGLLAGWGLKPQPKPGSGPVQVVEVVQPAPAPTRLGTVEAIFEGWRRFAAWDDDDTTEIAVWNADSGEFVEFYEVKRLKGLYFFRWIPKLTRVLSVKPLPVDCPLRFTEPWSSVSPETGATAIPVRTKPVLPARPPPGGGVGVTLPAAPKIDPPKIVLPPPPPPSPR